MLPPIPASWRSALRGEVDAPYYSALDEFLESEARKHTVFPPRSEIFCALELTPFRNVKVVILGQDPYAGPGQAHGLAFSVRPSVPPPPSLRNIYKELSADVGFRTPNHGCLEPWAASGVLLLNAILTVRAHQPSSHRRVGWEEFTDRLILRLSAKRSLVVFVLWGAEAQKKSRLIDTRRHAIIAGPHPSPLSANSGFLGSRPFSRINAALSTAGKTPIDWALPDI